MTRNQKIAKCAFDLSRDARRKHGRFKSSHEAYGVLLEEVDEFFQFVKEKGERRDLVGLYLEALDIAAVAIRIACECHNEDVWKK